MGVGHGHDRLFRRLVGDAQRAPDVLCVDHDLSPHGHDGCRRVIGRGRPGPESLDLDRRIERAKTLGHPVGEDRELESGGDQFLVEIARRLLGGGQDVAGLLVDRPPDPAQRDGVARASADKPATVSAIRALFEWSCFPVSSVFVETTSLVGAPAPGPNP